VKLDFKTRNDIFQHTYIQYSWAIPVTPPVRNEALRLPGKSYSQRYHQTILFPVKTEWNL